ncbi:MAG: DUF1343 domain-containing protein [Anaerolineae bacterium]|nr:MAG: DUF1343 domain-containing protein [Anaerolineae bacterium]
MVFSGLDVSLGRESSLLRGARVGFITNHTSVTRDLTPGVEALLAAGVRVAALFSPEHGLAGSAADGATVPSGLDRRTGLPIYSLYGQTRRPTPDMLTGLDVLLFDIQDVGARFYTYVWTMTHAMEAAAEAGSPFIVLDRPNPIGGGIVEGPVLEPAFSSFVGRYPVPVRHGLTAGELAAYVNSQFGVGADLRVVPVESWRREQWFDETGLAWVPPSPAMPSLATATVYPGACLIEGTNLSEGRGTALPFEVVGAPWVHGHALAEALNGEALPGVCFRAAQFVPVASKWAGQVCCGVQWHVLDRRAFRPVETALYLIAVIRSLWPEEFAWLAASWEGRAPHFDLLMGTDRVRRQLESGLPVATVVAGWQAGLGAFRERRQSCLCYL